MPDVQCVNCGGWTSDMDGACDHCQQSVFQQVKDVFKHTQASQERAMFPRNRADFLQRQNELGRPMPHDADVPFLRELADAESLMDQTDQDVSRCMSEMAMAQHWLTSEHINERELTPEQRSKYVWAIGTELRWEAARERARKARARYMALAEKFSEIQNETRPAPSTRRPDAWVGPWWRDGGHE